MKRITLTTGLLILVLFNPCKAQFFSHVYGEQNADDLSDAIMPEEGNDDGTGYFMTGKTVSASGVFDLTTTFASLSGVIAGANYFNKSYRLYHNSSSVANVGKQAALEIPDNYGGGFGVITDFSGPAYGIAYIKLNASGSAIGTYNYASSQDKIFDVKGVTLIKDGPDALATGNVHDLITGTKTFFLCSFNCNTGALNWIREYKGYYNQKISYEIQVNDIFPSDHDTNKYFIIGYSKPLNDPNRSDKDAFITSFDIVLGQFAPYNYDYSNTFHPHLLYSDEEFVAAEQDVSTGGAIFLIGNTNSNGTDRTFVSVLDPQGTPTPDIWLSEYNYNTTPTSSKEFAADITVRINSNGLPDVFSLVFVNDANLGGFDWVVYKYDLVSQLPLGQYTYGDLYIDEPRKIFYNSNGLAIFGNTTLDNISTYNTGLGSVDQQMLKTYFNGVLDCGEEIKTFYTTNHQLNTLPTVFDIYIHALPTQASNSVQELTLLDLSLCYSSSIPSGDNAFSIPTDDPNSVNDIQIAPNPMLPGVSTATVHFESDVEEDVQVVVYDMMGREYFKGTFTVKEGSNDFTFELPIMQMAKGMYTVKVTGTTINHTTRLMVQ